MTMIFLADGAQLKVNLRDSCFAEALFCDLMPKENMIYGKGVIGSTPFVMRRITSSTWIIFITIRSSMGWRKAFAIGLIRRFTVMYIWD